MMFMLLWTVYAAGGVVCIMHLDLDAEARDERAYWVMVLAWPMTALVYLAHWARARWMRP